MFDIKTFSDLSKYPSYSILRDDFDYFLDQITKENEIDHAKKKECLGVICTIPIRKGKREFEDDCNHQYFFKNKLLGPKCSSVISKNPFVHINDLDSFIKWMAEITGITYANVRVKLNEITYATVEKNRAMLLKSFFKNKVISVTYSDSNCIKYFGVPKWGAKSPPLLKDALISSFYGIQWSFPKPISEDIFENPDVVQSIGCRTGLNDPSKKIIFTHKLDDSYKVKKPTVLDAGFYQHYEPGGLTKPLPACANQSGFEEYVHKPNHFSNLENKFYEIF